MPSRPKQKEVTLERERRAWELRQKCWSQERIATEIGVTQQAVSAMLDRVEKRLLAQMAQQAERTKARQTAQHERVAEEAWDAWERSTLDAESTETTTEHTEIKGKGGDPMPATITRTKHTRRGQSGDPRHLQNVMSALSNIRGVWGLNAAAQTQVDVTTGGQPIGILYVNDWRSAPAPPDQVALPAPGPEVDPDESEEV